MKKGRPRLKKAPQGEVEKVKYSLEELNYPPEEDIYNNAEETDLDPENLSKNKLPAERPQLINEKDFNDDKTGGDLDVPGSELDDEQEAIGSEDEENNIYSLGDTK